MTIVQNPRELLPPSVTLRWPVFQVIINSFYLFQTLNKVSPVLHKGHCVVASYPENKEKNRSQEILACKQSSKGNGCAFQFSGMCFFYIRHPLITNVSF